MARVAVFPYAGLLRFLLSPNTQIRLCFTLKCRIAVYICCFCPADVCFPGGGRFAGWSPTLLMGAVPALCRNAPIVQGLSLTEQWDQAMAIGGVHGIAWVPRCGKAN